MQPVVLYMLIAACMAMAILYYRNRGPERFGWLIGIALAGLAALFSPQIILVANSLAQTIALCLATALAIIMISVLINKLIAAQLPLIKARIAQRKADKEKDKRLEAAERYWQRKEAEKQAELLKEETGVIDIEQERKRRKVKKDAFSEEYFYEESEPLEAESEEERQQDSLSSDWLMAAEAESKTAIETAFAVEHQRQVTEAKVISRQMDDMQLEAEHELVDAGEVGQAEDNSTTIRLPFEETSIPIDIDFTNKKSEYEHATGHEIELRAEKEAARSDIVDERKDELAETIDAYEAIWEEPAKPEGQAVDDEFEADNDIDNYETIEIEDINEIENINDVEHEMEIEEAVKTEESKADENPVDDLDDKAIDLLDRAWKHREAGEWEQSLQAYDEFCAMVGDERLRIEVQVEELATMLSAGMDEAAADKVFEILSFGEELRENESQQVIKALEYLQNI